MERDLKQLEIGATETPALLIEVPLVRLIHAAVEGDLATARAQLGQLRSADDRLLGQGFILRAARRTGDTEAVKAATAEIDAFRAVNLNSAFVHRMTRVLRERARRRARSSELG